MTLTGEQFRVLAKTGICHKIQLCLLSSGAEVKFCHIAPPPHPPPRLPGPVYASTQVPPTFTASRQFFNLSHFCGHVVWGKSRSEAGSDVTLRLWLLFFFPVTEYWGKPFYTETQFAEARRAHLAAAFVTSSLHFSGINCDWIYPKGFCFLHFAKWFGLLASGWSGRKNRKCGADWIRGQTCLLCIRLCSSVILL
jgi:hypothetical protein